MSALRPKADTLSTERYRLTQLHRAMLASWIVSKDPKGFLLARYSDLRDKSAPLRDPNSLQVSALDKKIIKSWRGCAGPRLLGIEDGIGHMRGIFTGISAGIAAPFCWKVGRS
jgi:hypothetical protein